MSPRGPGYATLAVLQALADGHRYGFDIIDRTGLASGTVYPALASLTKRGLANSRWEDEEAARTEGRPRRRYYELTAAGADELEAALERMARMGLTPRAPHPGPEGPGPEPAG